MAMRCMGREMYYERQPATGSRQQATEAPCCPLPVAGCLLLPVACCLLPCLLVLPVGVVVLECVERLPDVLFNAGAVLLGERGRIEQRVAALVEEPAAHVEEQGQTDFAALHHLDRLGEGDPHDRGEISGETAGC